MALGFFTNFINIICLHNFIRKNKLNFFKILFYIIHIFIVNCIRYKSKIP